MAGIYIHIPFCRRKCHYCNFFSLASQKLLEPFLKTLKQEIVQTHAYLGEKPVDTIYFGGGTPSLCSPRQLQEIIELVLSLHPNPAITKEFTLELNPDDVTEEYVAGLKKTFFNRFSLGVQSFFNEDLQYLNRSHSAGQSLRAVHLLQQAGYGNISIDLIYGIPSSTLNRWEQNLDTAFSLGIPHISAYALTVEQKTPLAWMIDKKKSPPVSDESQVDQFNLLMEKTKTSGYLQYEISNYCKPGWHALHNTNYWSGIPYLGLGPSAHSFNGISRRWNISNLTKYLDGLNEGNPIFEEEILTITQKYNEYVMTSLRTMWGCDGQKIIFDFGMTMYDLFRHNASPMIKTGLLTAVSGVYFLTDKGKLFADKVACELFLTD